MEEYLDAVLAGVEEPFPGFAHVIKINAGITNGALWVWNIVTGVFIVSDNFEAHFGYGGSPLKKDYRWWLDKIQANDHARVLSELRSVLKHDHRTWASEYRFRCVDNNFVDVFSKGIVIPDRNGDPVIMVCSMVDIGDRRNQQRLLTESYEHLHNLTQRLQKAREEERSYIARELHDEFAQMLTALKLDLFWLQKNFSIDNSQLQRHTKDMCDLVDVMMDRTRELAADLRPRVLDKLGVCAAIEWQIEQLELRTDCCYLLDNQMDNLKFSHTFEVAVFRIFQEALTNTVRHANAKNVHVLLKLDNEKNFILKIDDDGVGIDESKIFDTGSIGMTGMRERAFSLGGEIIVKPLTSGGTSVVLRVPAEILQRQMLQ